MIRIVLAAALFAAPALWAQDAKKDYCSDDDAKAHIDACKKDYKAKTDEDHISYIEKLGEKKNLKILDLLLHFVGKGASDVQIAAAKEIGKYKGEAKASEALLNAAKTSAADKKNGVALTQKLLFQVGEVAHRAHAKQLQPFWSAKFALDIQTEAVTACGKLRSKDSIDPLLALLHEIESIKEDKAASIPGGPGGAPPPPATDDEKLKRRSLADPIISALFDITQYDKKPRSCNEWENWWRKNKSTFKEQPE